MKKLLLSIPLLIFSGCQDEGGAELANKGTFLRYFGSEYSHTPNLALEAEDGFILLSTIDVPTEVIGRFQNKIKLTKTDLFGNLLWEHVYPEFTTEPVSTVSLRASTMMITDDAYVVVGEQSDVENISDPTDLAMLKVDFSGQLIALESISGEENALPASSFSGKGIAQNTNGNYMVLGSLTNNGTDNMLVTEVLASDVNTQVWTRFYGDGTGNLASRLFINAQGELVWGGTSGQQSNLDARLVRSKPNDGSSLSTKSYVTSFQEITYDISNVTGGTPGYAIIGSTNQNIAQNGDDIFILKVDPSGNESFTKVLDFGQQNDAGTGISSTRDGGLIAVGNGISGNNRGFGQSDIFVVRLNNIGEEIWSKNYGASAKDEAVSVRQTSDDGYLIFGSSVFGTNSKKLVLLKIDKNGQL
jgi:hypothetical protein